MDNSTGNGPMAGRPVSGTVGEWMLARSTTPSLIGTATLWCMPCPNCAGLGVQDGVNGDGLVLRLRRVPGLRRDRTGGIFVIPQFLRALLTPCRLTTPY